MAISELIEIQSVVRVKGPKGIWTQYLSIWNVADWTAVFGGIAIVTVFIASISMRTELNQTLEELGAMPWTIWDTDTYKLKLSYYVDRLTENCNYVRYLRLALAVYPSFIIVRLFKSFAAQPKLALVTKTLASATPDLLHFAIVFSSVFVTFAICGIVLFGKELRAFTNASRSILTCFRVMLGDIVWEDLAAVGRLEASVWLWSFIIIVTLLMLNMILAIIMDNYEQVKMDTGYAETLVEEAIQWYSRTRGIRNGTYVPLEGVLDSVNFEVRQRQERKGETGKLSRMLSNVFASRSIRSWDSSDSVGNILPKNPVSKEPSSSFDDLEDASGLRLDSTGDVIITKDHLIKLVASFHKKTKMSSKQALDIMEGALDDFYARHKEGAELDEVMQVIKTVSFRTKKLVKLAKRAHDLRDFGPVEELKWFGMEVEEYVEHVRKEREAALEEVERLKIEKQRLSQRLLCFPPDAVFPSGSMSESNMFRVGNAPRSSDASQSITELSLDDLLGPTEESL
mmetsp:Transcript_154343/g.273740  ORF Transcript_154343/g.273740 Transcript_154343/m.273740 type:complete len:512 (+) Transcript_154343:1-1536(+)